MIKTMRTKKLMIAALAMPLAFAACTNEEFAEINNSQVLESENVVAEKMVVGKELIADGAVIKLSKESLSRVTNNDFDENDKLGFAWFLNPVATDESDALTKTIFDTQDTKAFNWNVNEIYNNYLIQKNPETDEFEVNGEMYAGAYFMYYPYQKIGGLGKTLDVDYSSKAKNTQTEKISDKDVFDKIVAKSFHLSHKMTFSQAKEDFKLEVKAAPKNTMNTFAVKPTLHTKGDVYEATKAWLDEIKIEQVDITVNEKIFANKAQVDLTKLPKANAGKWNADATRNLIEQAVIYTGAPSALNVADSDRKNILTTYVANGNTLADADLGYILLSTFATKTPTAAFKKEATVKITTNVGTFSYTCDENSDLVKRMTDSENEKYLSTHTYVNTVVNMELDMAKLSLKKTGIKDPQSWNLLMKLLDAQGVDANVTVSNLKFTDECPMELPENINITVTSGDITFESGVQTIGKEFTTSGKLIVSAEATLDLTADVTAGKFENNGTTNVNAVLTTDDFNNVAGGTVNVAEGMGIVPAGTADYTNNGTINCYGNIGGKVANTGGVINVTYGATTVLHDKKGVIHGILDAAKINDQTKAIMQMIGEKSEVKCNSIELIGFEITEGDKSYEWSAGYSFEIGDATFKDINVKLVNSTLSKEGDAACEFKFKGLTLVNSTVTGNIKSTIAVEAEESTITGNLDAESKNVTLTNSTVTGDVKGAQITLTSTEVEGNVIGSGAVALTKTTITGDVTGTTISINDGSITGDVTASKDFTIEDATVNGKLDVDGQMTIENSTVTAAEGSSFAKGLVAENSILEGSFIGLTKDVELTNCTINASEIITTEDLVINANGVAFNINNTVLEAFDVTFNGNKNVVFNNTTLEAGNDCNVNTNVTGKGTISAYDYHIAPKKSIDFTYVEK